MEMNLSKFFLSILTVLVIRVLIKLYNAIVAQPRRLRSALTKQGLSSPPCNFFLGNILDMKRARDTAAMTTPINGPPISHNCGATIFPFFDQWRKQYGNVFMFSIGTTQIMFVTQPEMVREITTCTSLDLGKPTYQARDRGPLLGQGILTSNGPYWAHQRKILAPELYMDKVKGMVSLIQDCTMSLVNKWEQIVETKGGLADIKIDKHMRTFSGDVISRACFGSSYSKGEEIFLKLRALQEVSSKSMPLSGVPGMSRMPTKANREAWALEKEIKTLILNLVKERGAASFEKDLLQMVLEGAKNSGLNQDSAINRFIVDNCKNIYLAGYETTAVSATWLLMLLASNPEWQEQIRSEVIQVCNGQIPDSEMIRKMKLLTMAINESLRLYPPVSIISREVFNDLKFGGLTIPKGVNVWSLVTLLHTDPDVWGPDSYQFNPARFSNGITGACKFPHLYMPFGVGPRVCLGQNLAMVELKLLVSVLLSRFSFSLSPKYVHSPALHLVIVPANGVNILIKKL